MSLSDKDQRVLKSLSAARKNHPELADLLNFYYDLFELQFRAKREVPEPQVRDDKGMRWCLESGVSQLSFGQLGVQHEPFARLVGRMVSVLVRHNPGWKDYGGAWSAEELVALARELFESGDTPAVQKPDGQERESDGWWAGHLQLLAVSSALVPYLQRASETILPRLDLALWTQGYCPVCSGQPNLALFEATRGARKLMCSRCDSLWGYARVGCPFCQSANAQTYYPGEFGLYRLYVCPLCNHYLKTVDLREVHREIHPVVERLLMVGMDLSARREGYEG